MTKQNPIPIYDMFPFLKGNERLTVDFSGARVDSAVVNKEKANMSLTLTLAQPTPPLELREIESMIAHEFDLSSVTITPLYSRAAVSSAATGKTNGSTANPTKSKSAVLLGRQIKGEAVPMGEIGLELGKATIMGEVCDVTSRRIEKRNAWLLGFDLTDYTGTIHVSKYMMDENAAGIVKKIKKGMWLKVSGNLNMSRYSGDLELDPSSIAAVENKEKIDTAEEKRVELHLHTKMSALDAVTDTKEVIARAAKWGHPAIAITDHGVVHSFPEAAAAASACGGKIKVIYGLEGYFINDLDHCKAVHGSGELSAVSCQLSADDECDCKDDRPWPPDSGGFSGEFVVFDIETTGLSPVDDAIIEIGAVLVTLSIEEATEDSEPPPPDSQLMAPSPQLALQSSVTARFSTFVDPGRAVPYTITNITGITDDDVKGAPSERDAVKAFIDFVGGRPLVAHNAAFDIGFIYEACQRHSIPFHPNYIDTLPMSRFLLQWLKNHKLETLAKRFAPAKYQHHRAAEDAEATMHVFCGLLKRLANAGITEIAQINPHLAKLAANSPKKGRGRTKHIILLAKNDAGLKNLYKLITKSHLDDFDRYPIIRKSVLAQHREGLIVGSACEAGEIFEAVSGHQSGLVLRQIAEFYDYLEIQPICNNMFMLYGDKPRAGSEDDLRNFNRRIVELGKSLGKPVVATGDVHFLDPEHEVYRHVLLTSKNYEGAGSKLPIYFRTTDEMLGEFSYLGEETAYDVVVGNTRLIAGMCENISPLPPAKTLYPPSLDRSAEDLKELVSSRMAELYGDAPPEIVTKLVETELGDILARGYDVIYMAAQKLVAESLKNGYLVGSRGSVGSSVVAFLAGITEVNALPAHYRCPKCRNSDFESGACHGCGADMPDANCPKCGETYLKDGFNIPFETFLGFDGDKVPDIDLNFSGEFQAQAHKFTIELFGADNVYRAGTIGKVADKTAYGYVKKYLETIGKTVTKAEENRLTRGCAGVKRTTGQHPGGLIVIPQGRQITDFCPAQHPADSGEKGIITTHFEYHSMEDNLIKIDALGHDDPTMIKLLEDMTGVDAREIRLDDSGTMSIFSSPLGLGLPDDDEIIGATGTIGVPEFGTPFTRQMLCDTKPKTFDTLVRLSGFSHGTDVWLGNAKDLILTEKATVDETISCRDDIMLFLISKGMDDRYAFKISESVRKGRGLPEGTEAEMTGHGVPGWYIESCKKIKYLFPKAHAVAYVMMAFRIAWFKVNRPLEFYSAYFYRRSQKDAFDAGCMTLGLATARSKIREIKNNPDAKGKDEDLLTTLEACYEFYLRGFEFANLDIYDSDPTKFLIVDEKKLRPPLIAVSGLGETAAFDVATNRTDNEFISIDEISSACTKLTKTNLEQLKDLGALRNLPESSQLSLF